MFVLCEADVQEVFVWLALFVHGTCSILPALSVLFFSMLVFVGVISVVTVVSVTSVVFCSPAGSSEVVVCTFSEKLGSFKYFSFFNLFCLCFSSSLASLFFSFFVWDPRDLGYTILSSCGAIAGRVMLKFRLRKKLLYRHQY